MKWTTRPLADLADFRLGKMLDEKKNRGESRPYLANVNVRWGEFDLAALRQMRFEEDELDKYGLRYGDIVMCEGGEPGRCAIWRDAVPGMMIQKALHRIRPNEQIDHLFLFYSFLQKGKTGAFAPLITGATIKHLPKEKLAQVRIEFPELEIQRKIAATLSTYDDLIENNRRRMRLLEESARLLYQELFVRPLSSREGGVAHGLPEGWRSAPLGSITSKIGSGATPRGGSAAYVSKGVTLIRSMNVYDERFDDDGLAFIDDRQAEDLNGVTVMAHDILLNITGASVGRCCMAPERFLPARVNQHVAIIRVDPEKASPFLVQAALNSDERKRQLLSYAQKGSTREALTKEMLERFEIVLPPSHLTNRFDELARPAFSLRENLAHQNQKLKTARDLLLPRLMSGELNV